jgi:ABC-2 type transport system ATP-binding protein
MIEVNDLKIHYGEFVAVDQLSFSVSPGSIFGLIGPNGAGKTSALKAIATLLEPTYGEILVQGVSALHQPEQARSFLGYMPDFPPVYEDLKIWEFCDLFAQAYGLIGEQKKAKVLLSLHATGLQDQMHTLCRTLSRGMRQRALLAKTLVHQPSVLLLDEPAANLDPKSRIDLRNILKSLAHEGKTILLSSHVLSEIEDTCDTLGFMREGKMVLSGSLDEISQARQNQNFLKIRLAKPFPPLEKIISSIPSLSQFEDTGGNGAEARACLDGGEKEASEVLTRLVEAGVPVSGFAIEKPRVEDLFLELESQPAWKGDQP